jgi:hypothetical protein
MLQQIAGYLLYAIGGWCAVGVIVTLWMYRNVEGGSEPWYWRMVEALACLCLLAPGWPLLIWEAREREARKLVEQFERRFPGKCMICSMHRFGRNNGYEQKPEPEPHDCIERDPARACVGLRGPNLP